MLDTQTQIQIAGILVQHGSVVQKQQAESFLVNLMGQNVIAEAKEKECVIPDPVPPHPTRLEMLHFKGQEQQYLICRFNSIQAQLESLQRALDKAEHKLGATKIRGIYSALEETKRAYIADSRADLYKGSLDIAAGDSGIDKR